MGDRKKGRRNIHKPQEFSRRTLKNLEFITSHKNDKNAAGKPLVYEVTQLINSMLGLYIVFYEDEYYGAKITEKFNGKKFKDWEWLKSIEGKVCEKKQGKWSTNDPDISNFIKKLRHAFAHSNIEYITPPGQKDIEGIWIWNINPPKSNNVDWVVKMSLEELQNIVKGFRELVGAIDKASPPNDSLTPLIKAQIDDAKKLIDPK